MSITATFAGGTGITATFGDGTVLAASQSEVNTGTNLTKFVSPSTFAGASKWNTKINHALATAANDFLVASGVGVFVKKTLAEVKTILGLGSAAYTADTDYVKHSLVTAANDFLVASGNGAVAKKTLAETLAILKLWNSGTLTDGATIAADCDDYKQFAWDLTTVETATAITFDNVGKVIDVAIYKTNAADTVVTLAATGYIFHFFDADNDNYSLGTNCTLSGAAGTSYSLNMVVTGITPAGSAIIQCTGSYSNFS
jgi:hypothetical protein